MYRFIFSFIVLWLTPSAYACNDEQAKQMLANYKWLTEDYPPYNYIDSDGELKGIFTDIVLAIFDKLDVVFDAKDIELVPWARLYKNMQTKTTYAAFSMTYTADRAKKFKIVTTPLHTKISIMVLAKNYRKLKNAPLAELVLGVVREDIGHHLVEQTNLPSTLVQTTSASSMIKMLISGRVDAIAYAEEVALFQLENLSLTDQDLRPLLVLENNASHGFVFHKNTPECVVNLFEKTVVDLYYEGELVKIRDKYISQTNKHN